MNTPASHTCWLDEPKNVKRLWRGFIAVLVMAVLAEIVVNTHPKFAIEGLFGFSAAFGFIACVLMILGAKVLGWLIKRSDTYYSQSEDVDD